MRNRILIIIGIIICLFMLGLVSDVIRVHSAKIMSERCLEDIIKKGAVLIDTPLAAKEKIIQVSKTYGLPIENDEVTISQSSERLALFKIIVTTSISLRAYFAWLVGKKTLTLYLQKQADIERRIQPITELETVSLGILRPKGINFGFLYKLTLEPETNLLEEKLVGLDFEGSSTSVRRASKTIKTGNILKLRSLEENELDGLRTSFISACKKSCNLNNFHPRCPKLLKIAVIEPFEPIPSMVKVVGFACFFIEDVTVCQDTKCPDTIMGYFVEHYQPGISEMNEGIDFGLRTRSKIKVRIRE
ncbi:MAG: hypothetical protein QME42_07930 [bacterium]|nr:hypothetical protein [bacterium]